MERRKRILLLGGTGVLGKSLAPELLRQGYEVAITSRSAHTSNERGVMYLRGNAKDDAFLKELLAERFDAVVDFMIYTTDSFAARMQTLLNATQHYIFLSSYRVYGDSEGKPITEQSPRLLDVLDDPEYLKTDEYGLTKARQEDLLRRSGHGHFTIVRPAITYGGDRFQLGTMEANEFLVRALKNEPVIFPREMLDKQATMTWSGDVGTMIARLVLNERAFGETYTAATAEHHSRMLDRVSDNTKILTAADLRQTELMPLSDGLRIELGLFVRNPVFKPADVEMQKRFDRAARE